MNLRERKLLRPPTSAYVVVLPRFPSRGSQEVDLFRRLERHARSGARDLCRCKVRPGPSKATEDSSADLKFPCVIGLNRLQRPLRWKICSAELAG